MAEVLVIGSGGREQALAWKLAQSPSVTKVYVAPGNGGSRGNVENVPINFTDVNGLLEFAQQNSIDFTVIGQESASEAGVVDAFQKAGLSIFGPTKAAVKIESSKVLSKDLMASENIPTAAYKTFSDAAEALAYAKSRPLPVVVKADGLAEGKGVTVCFKTEDIEAAINTTMVQKKFGEAGSSVVIEDFLKGQEVSVHALCDGQRAVIFPASQDHKQINDGDQGPNTGGMGVIAPVPWVTQKHLDYVDTNIVRPALEGLAKQNADFTGCLYPGLMIDGDAVNVVEFNARFGDPEAEVYMRLLDSDLLEILKACANGNLDPSTVKWRSGFAVTVVLASPGYPGSYPKGLLITGIEEAEKLDDIVVFHAGTAVKDGQLVTNGGRVLNVTATGATLDEALDKAYAAVKLIHFEGMHYRTDIGRRPTR
ncbi:MAG TPA: phosphoribosylamine--glycine ligase [Candidatus Dormibacteraeota bacterium]|nr:phosphoribosylamine--glycine ligase [Candidatus Dormibacteraeota bacterium]